MSSQNSNTKTLFKSAVKNTGKFLSGLLSTEDMGPNPHTKSGQSPRGLPKLTKFGKFMDKFKDKDGYANSRQAYQNYLNSLDRLKTGYQSFSGAKVGTGMMSPKTAGRVRGIGRATTFEDTLSDWNARMRKFAVQRYYASLGKK